MRVLVIDELAEDLEERAETLRDGLARAGHEVVASLSPPLELLRAVERLRPDVIVIDTESPTRDVLEHLVIVSQSSPLPKRFRRSKNSSASPPSPVPRLPPPHRARL